MPLSAMEQRVCAAIERRRSALLEDLSLHVAIPTGPGASASLDETRERFTQRLRAIGASCRLVAGEPRPDWVGGRGEAGGDAPIPPTAVCEGPTRPGKRVLLAGHLDTVHPVDGAFRELSISPGGKTAVGPGCVDMKGGLVILVAALEALEECGVAARWTVLFNSDEETGSFHSDRAIRAAAADADFGLAVEPAMSDGGLAIERGGSGQFLIEAFGKSAHAGRDFFAGASAVAALAEAIVGASRLSDRSRHMVANIGPLQGGVASNVVPDLARAWGNLRFADEAGAAALEQGLRLLERGGESEVPRVRVRTVFNRPPKATTPGVRMLAEAARQVVMDIEGKELPFGRSGGVCDGNQMQAAGLATIDTLGVRGGGLHTEQEWIELASLVERCQELAVLVSRLSAG